MGFVCRVAAVSLWVLVWVYLGAENSREAVDKQRSKKQKFKTAKKQRAEKQEKEESRKTKSRKGWKQTSIKQMPKTGKRKITENT